ncbi:hypothetical protein ACB092_05G160300 [Castanea dentata]
MWTESALVTEWRLEAARGGDEEMSLQTVLSCHLWTESLFGWVPKIISWQAKSSATRNSLVALDELGRGTSTSEGQAIAESVLQHFVHKVQCQGMFSTHYH